MIDVESTKGVEHAKNMLKLGMEITPLEELHDRLRARLDLSKSKLEEFKAQFPVWLVFLLISFSLHYFVMTLPFSHF